MHLVVPIRSFVLCCTMADLFSQRRNRTEMVAVPATVGQVRPVRTHVCQPYGSVCDRSLLSNIVALLTRHSLDIQKSGCCHYCRQVQMDDSKSYVGPLCRHDTTMTFLPNRNPISFQRTSLMCKCTPFETSSQRDPENVMREPCKA